MKKHSFALMACLILCSLIVIGVLITNNFDCTINQALMPHATDPIDCSRYKHESVVTMQQEKTGDVLKRAILEKDYGKAVSLLSEVEQEMAEEYDFDYSQYLHTYHDLCVYVYLMADKPEDALKISNEIAERYGDTEPKWGIFVSRVTVLSRFNKFDEIIGECQKQLDNKNTPEFVKVVSLYTITLAYCMKNDLDKGRHYFELTKKSISVFSSEEDKEMVTAYLEMLQLTEYYLDHLLETHYYRFSREKLKLAERDESDPKGKRIVFEFSYPVEIISKTDGSRFTYEDMQKRISEEMKNMRDPFLDAVERMEINENDNPCSEDVQK